jgi:hypothetical protein
MAVDRHPLALLPPLDSADVALEVRGDVLPRFQPVVGRLPARCCCGIRSGRIGQFGLRLRAGRGAVEAAEILCLPVAVGNPGRSAGCLTGMGVTAGHVVIGLAGMETGPDSFLEDEDSRGCGGR